MNKEDFKKGVMEQHGVTEEKFNELYAQSEEKMKARGYSGEDLGRYTLMHMRMGFSKLKGSGITQKMFFVPIGASKPTDYGAEKKYNFSVQRFVEDPDGAFEQGLCTKDGTPIWPDGPDFKKGKPIKPDQEFQRVLYGMARYVEGDNEQTTWKPAHIVVKGKGDVVRIGVPMLGQKFEVELGIAEKATKERYLNKKYQFYTNEKSVFENGQPIDKVHEMIREVMGDSIIEASQVRSKHKQDLDMYDIFLFKANLQGIGNNPKGNYPVNIQMPFVDLSEDDMLTAWMPEDVPLLVKDEAMDVIFAVRGRYSSKPREDGSGGEEEVFSCDCLGMIATNPADVKTEENTPHVSMGNQTREESIESTPEEKVSSEPQKVTSMKSW